MSYVINEDEVTASGRIYTTLGLNLKRVSGFAVNVFLLTVNCQQLNLTILGIRRRKVHRKHNNKLGIAPYAVRNNGD
jgi:hypothetical protein